MAVAAFLFLANLAIAGDRQIVKVRLPPDSARQRPISRVPATTRLDLAIGLPLRHKQELTNALRRIYQPGNPEFRHYLHPDEFAAAYGPSEADYQAVLNFAKANGLTVTGTHPNRTLVDVNGAVGDIERALHVHMNLYRHPSEDRTYYAPDTQPSIDLATPVLAIGGLHNYTLPHPMSHPVSESLPAGQPQPAGSGTNGSYLGADFRYAYANGISLTGNGQTLGLVEFEGYNTSDITNYEFLAGITNDVPLENILLDGFSGQAGPGYGSLEVCIDIELVIAMAPGLSNILVYEGNPAANTAVNDVLNRIATDDQAAQVSCSYGFDIDAATDQIFQQYAAQGQSFFQASGDYDAYSGPVIEPVDDPNITVVGGTILSTTGPLGSWVSESVWNDGGGEGSSGGISVTVPIPFWQQGIDMTANRGSTTLRNLPDVAMCGYYAWASVNGSGTICQGTSLAAPLWAGLTALVNQQAALDGQPPLGFANPSIYSIAKSTNYSACFHDITLGDNTSPSSPSNFFAVAGYDLCSGWGTPIGSNLLAALLAPQDALVISPPLGFTAFGPVGGPFGVSSAGYWLTNAGGAPLNWSVAIDAAWLSASLTNGSLSPAGPGAAVTVALNAVASNLLMGEFSANVSFTNLQDGNAQSWPVVLLTGNGGFETGDFSYWNFSGDPTVCYVAGADDSAFPGSGDPLPGVPYADFVHSGLCGAYLGQNGSIGTLSQTLPTVAKQYYLLSAWLSSYSDDGATTPNEFQVNWNGTTLFDETNMGAFGWTNLQYIVSATGSATTLQFGFRDDPGAFGLDDITLQAVPTPVFQTATQNSGTVSLTWNALPGLSYQLQFNTDLTTTNWNNLGAPITAVSNIVMAADIGPTNVQRIYRFVVSP